MRNYNWLLLLISLAVHLAVISSLQLNLGQLAPANSSILLQLLKPADPPKQPVPEPQKPPALTPEPIPQVVAKQSHPKANQQVQRHKQPQASPTLKPVVQQAAAVVTNTAGSFEIPTSARADLPGKTAKPQIVPKQQPLRPPAPELIPAPEPPPPVDVSALLREYAGGVKRAILARKLYPATAERLGQEGTVQVGFNIAADGSLSSLSVNASSGYNSLDAAALGTVQNAAPFQAIPPSANRSSLSMSISLKFYLE